MTHQDEATQRKNQGSFLKSTLGPFIGVIAGAATVFFAFKSNQIADVSVSVAENAYFAELDSRRLIILLETNRDIRREKLLEIMEILNGGYEPHLRSSLVEDIDTIDAAIAAENAEQDATAKAALQEQQRIEDERIAAEALQELTTRSITSSTNICAITECNEFGIPY